MTGSSIAPTPPPPEGTLPLRSLLASRDGRYLAANDERHQVTVWDLAQRALVATYQGLGPRFTPDGTSLWILQDSLTLVRRPILEGPEIRRIRLRFPSHTLVLDRDTSLCLTSGGDVVSLEDGRMLACGKPFFRVAAFSPDGRTVQFHSPNGYLQDWDWQDGRWPAEPPRTHGWPVGFCSALAARTPRARVLAHYRARSEACPGLQYVAHPRGEGLILADRADEAAWYASQAYDRALPTGPLGRWRVTEDGSDLLALSPDRRTVQWHLGPSGWLDGWRAPEGVREQTEEEPPGGHSEPAVPSEAEVAALGRAGLRRLLAELRNRTSCRPLGTGRWETRAALRRAEDDVSACRNSGESPSFRAITRDNLAKAAHRFLDAAEDALAGRSAVRRRGETCEACYRAFLYGRREECSCPDSERPPAWTPEDLHRHLPAPFLLRRAMVAVVLSRSEAGSDRGRVDWAVRECRELLARLRAESR